MKKPFLLIVMIVMFMVGVFGVSAVFFDTRPMVAKKPAPRVVTVAPDLAPIEKELSRLKKDLDVCHQRVTDAFFAIDVVSRVPGKRARAPRTPVRVRP